MDIFNNPSKKCKICDIESLSIVCWNCTEEGYNEKIIEEDNDQVSCSSEDEWSIVKKDKKINNIMNKCKMLKKGKICGNKTRMGPRGNYMNTCDSCFKKSPKCRVCGVLRGTPIIDINKNIKGFFNICSPCKKGVYK